MVWAEQCDAVSRRNEHLNLPTRLQNLIQQHKYHTVLSILHHERSMVHRVCSVQIEIAVVQDRDQIERGLW